MKYIKERRSYRNTMSPGCIEFRVLIIVVLIHIAPAFVISSSARNLTAYRNLIKELDESALTFLRVQSLLFMTFIVDAQEISPAVEMTKK